jgi:pimeloyl-ACP methyl ester carboxylesterase
MAALRCACVRFPRIGRAAIAAATTGEIAGIRASCAAAPRSTGWIVPAIAAADKYMQAAGKVTALHLRKRSEMHGFEMLDAEISGVPLRVARRGHGPRAILALHGLAGSHVTMSAIGRQFGDEWSYLAPDLRGRGASADAPGPFGLDVHAGDCLGILDHFGIERASLVGHSMGALIAPLIAAEHPGRVESLTLIDGGLVLPIELPPGTTAADLATQLLGPLVANLERTFPTPGAYLAQWRAYPGLGGLWNDELEARFAYEMTGEPGEIRSRISIAAVRDDWADAWANLERSIEALQSVRCPVRLFRAPRGLLDQPEPMVSDELVAEWSRRLPQLVETTLPGTNHLTIGILDAATAAIAEAVSSPGARSAR